MKLDSDEDTYAMVVAEGRAFTFVCHELGKNGIEFYAKHDAGRVYVLYVNIANSEWLKNAIYALAAQRLL
jgi:hypothetical protein